MPKPSSRSQLVQAGCWELFIRPTLPEPSHTSAAAPPAAARLAEQAPEPFDKEITMCDQLAAYLRKFVVEEAAAAEEEKRDLSGALEGFKPLQARPRPVLRVQRAAALHFAVAPPGAGHAMIRATVCLPACLRPALKPTLPAQCACTAFRGAHPFASSWASPSPAEEGH